MHSTYWHMAVSASGFGKGLWCVYIHHRPSQHRAASVPFPAHHSNVLNGREIACVHVHLQSCCSITSATSANPRNISCSASPRSTRHWMPELRVSARPPARPPHNPNTCSFISQYAMIGTPSQSLARHAWLLRSRGQSSAAATASNSRFPSACPTIAQSFHLIWPVMRPHRPQELAPSARLRAAPCGMF